MWILIPDSPSKNVVAAIRVLGRAGHKVVLAQTVKAEQGSRRMSAWRKSRYCHRVMSITSPFRSVEGYLGDIERELQTGIYNVVLPFTHAAVACCSYGKRQIEAYARMPFPGFDVFMEFHNKARTVGLAQQCGVPVPRTSCPKTREDLLQLKDSLTYPAVIKARVGCGVRQGVRYARNWPEVVTGYEAITSQASYGFLDNYERPMIQEFVPGKIHDAVMLSNREGQVRAAVTQVREVTYPLSGGPGAVNRTTYEPQIVEYGKALIRATGWYGPLMFEFKLDSRDGSYRLLEVNPKFWGTLDLSIRAGVNFPLLACSLAANGDSPSSMRYEHDLTYRWLVHGELMALAEGKRDIRVWADFLRRFFQRHTVYDFRPTDMRPDIYALIGRLGRFLQY